MGALTGLAAAARPRPAARAERVVVLLVAAHSLGVGLLLLFAPRFAVRFAGWGDIEPLFLARQAGVFHAVLAFGYLAEHFRDRGVVLLVAAKAAATLFLLAATAAGGVPWAVPFCAAADGLMGTVALLAHRRASAERDAVG